MNNNSRFIDLGGGLVAETIATQTMLNYDPTTNSAVGFFLGQLFIKPDGSKYMRVGDTVDHLTVSMSGRGADFPVPSQFGFRDPHTGIDLSQLSYDGLMIVLKVIYDREHNARAAAQAAAPAPNVNYGSLSPSPPVGLDETS